MIGEYLRAGYPLLYIQTFEPERVLEFLLDEIKSNDLKHLRPHIWKPHTGLYAYNTDWKIDQLADSIEDTIRLVLRDAHLVNSGVQNIYIFFGIDHYFERPPVLYGLRDAADKLRTNGSHIVCLGPERDIPEELRDIITIVRFDYPDIGQLTLLFENILTEYRHVIGEDISSGIIERAAMSAKGLSIMQAEGAAALSIVNGKPFDVSYFNREKSSMLRQSVAIRYIDTENLTFDDLGGFDILKQSVSYRKRYFLHVSEAKKFGILAPPKGIFIIGIPGTGKSLSAKCIANELNLPLYKLDIGALFRSYVGDSEANTRRALSLVEALSPCVLLLDEMEKMVAGLKGSGTTDSGVTARVMATLLSWMQDSRAPIYKVATANTLENIDASLIRRGRWDAVFAVDVPTYSERKEIFRIVLRRRGFDPKGFHLNVLSSDAVGFVGAEIESAIDEALFRAFSDEKPLTTMAIRDSLRSIVPLAETHKEEIERFRLWLLGRAQNVSSKD